MVLNQIRIGTLVFSKIVPTKTEKRYPFGAQAGHSHLKGIVFNAYTRLLPQCGQRTPFGQRRATRYALQASSSGNSLSNRVTVICLVNFGAAMGVISVSDRNPTPFKSIRQAPHNRPRER